MEQAGPGDGRVLADVPDCRSTPRRPGKLSYQETTLQFGALKGETALTWYQGAGLRCSCSDERRAVFVTGALTRQELIAYAEGLQPVAPPR